VTRLRLPAVLAVVLAAVAAVLVAGATPASAATTTLTPSADSYVQADKATTNFGTATTLNADASPVTNAYVKFSVTGLTAAPTKATLRLFSRSTGTTSVRIYPVADSGWTEAGITFDNAPAAGATSLGNSGALVADTYFAVDVTPAVTANGTFSFLVNTGSTAVRLLDSREGANPPQLVLETTDAPPTTSPTTPPPTTPPTTTGPPPPADPFVLAGGDVACAADDANYNGGAGTATGCHMRATSDLLLANPAAAVLALGDLQYNSGSLSAFQSIYGPSWGRLKAITKPVLGNHEYGQSGAGGYFSYFGAASTPLEPGCVKSCKGYYSFDVGTWHVVVLNTECTRIDGGAGCAVGSAQEQWLKADLAGNPKACTMVLGHRPRWSSNGFASSDIAPLMDVMYSNGVDLYLSGHSHSYERFAPQNPAGARDDAAGVREFVVGTGGRDSSGFGTTAANSELRKNKIFGVLKVSLGAGSYDWSYLPDPGTPFADSGRSSCH
jgi:hypothetical protein